MRPDYRTLGELRGRCLKISPAARVTDCSFYRCQFTLNLSNRISWGTASNALVLGEGGGGDLDASATRYLLPNTFIACWQTWRSSQFFCLDWPWTIWYVLAACISAKRRRKSSMVLLLVHDDDWWVSIIGCIFSPPTTTTVIWTGH